MLVPAEFSHLPWWRRVAIRILTHPLAYMAIFGVIMVAAAQGVRWSYAAIGVGGPLAIIAIALVIGQCIERADRARGHR